LSLFFYNGQQRHGLGRRKVEAKNISKKSHANTISMGTSSSSFNNDEQQTGPILVLGVDSARLKILPMLTMAADQQIYHFSTYAAKNQIQINLKNNGNNGNDIARTFEIIDCGGRKGYIAWFQDAIRYKPHTLTTNSKQTLQDLSKVWQFIMQRNFYTNDKVTRPRLEIYEILVLYCTHHGVKPGDEATVTEMISTLHLFDLNNNSSTPITPKWHIQLVESEADIANAVQQLITVQQQ